MQQRFIFLDVDGTVMNGQHTISPAVREAIIETRRRGHKVFLCTGRSPVEIFDWVWAIGFDGKICVNGGYTEYEGNVLRTATLPPALLDAVMKFLQAHGYEFSVQCLYDLRVSPGFRAFLLSNMRRAAEAAGTVLPQQVVDDLGVYVEGLPWGTNDAAKLTFYHPGGANIGEVRDAFGDTCTVIPGSMPGGSNGELTLQGVSKGAAVKALVDQLGLDRAATVAVGDSENDRELIEYCGLGVAMGNARQTIKDVADVVTDSVDDDGVATALSTLL